MIDRDVETVRRSLAQYDAWGIREGWTMMSAHTPALDRILARIAELETKVRNRDAQAHLMEEQSARIADLLAASHSLLDAWDEQGTMGQWVQALSDFRAAIAAAHQGEET